MSRPDNFISNFEPLTCEQIQTMSEKVTEFDQFTAPMRELLRSAADAGKGFAVCSANPRLVNGKPSKNPRYLQIRPDLVNPLHKYVGEMGMRFFRAIPADKPLLMPVEAVLVGRRNNPEDKAHKIRGLAVYNPIHYQELPELFMDFICSLTGKSPSTTGAGSEGALTKAPFNAVRPTADLNAALVSYILTGLGGFSTSAGFVGPHYQVDHDISLLVPEIWCRLSRQERDPESLKRDGYLEPLKDYDHKGERILASRLGYRITSKFVRAFFGRVFDNPLKVFDDELLKPETQDADAFADGIKNITETQQRVAQEYVQDGSIADACPPLRRDHDHGNRIVRRKRRAASRDPRHVHTAEPACQRLVPQAIGSQATGGHRPVETPRGVSRHIPSARHASQRGRAIARRPAARTRGRGAGAGRVAGVSQEPHRIPGDRPDACRIVTCRG